MLRGVLFLVLLLAAPFLRAQRWQEAVAVNPASAPIVVDGVLEEQWFDRAPAYDLVNHDGSTSNLIVENYLTMFRTLADEEYWYLSFVCSDDEPLATLTGRDAPIWKEEICELMVQCPAGRWLYELSISPLGTVYDARLFWNKYNHFEVDVSWNFSGILSAVGRLPYPEDPERCVWTVELAIPWSNIPGGRPVDGGVLKANVLRYKRLRNPEFLKLHGSAFLSMNLFATGIKGWPAGPSSFGRFRFFR